MEFENQAEIGIGIYTPSEIATILRVPTHKVNRWIDTYWDGQLGEQYEARYSWKVDNSKAVSFHTLVEFYVMMQFSEAGVKPKQVLTAHKELSELYNSAFPFANKEVLAGIRTDSKKIYFTIEGNIITLDGTKQFNLGYMELFFKNLEFDADQLASRFWPMGKDKSILVDPMRKFGHPIVDGKNIFPETLNNHFKAGDPIRYIAQVYDLTEQQVSDAIQFCNAA